MMWILPTLSYQNTVNIIFFGTECGSPPDQVKYGKFWSPPLKSSTSCLEKKLVPPPSAKFSQILSPPGGDTLYHILRFRHSKNTFREHSERRKALRLLNECWPAIWHSFSPKPTGVNKTSYQYIFMCEMSPIKFGCFTRNGFNFTTHLQPCVCFLDLFVIRFKAGDETDV